MPRLDTIRLDLGVIVFSEFILSENSSFTQNLKETKMAGSGRLTIGQKINVKNRDWQSIK